MFNWKVQRLNDQYREDAQRRAEREALAQTTQTDPDELYRPTRRRKLFHSDL